MTDYKETLISHKIGAYSVTVSVQCCGGSHWFEDLYTVTDQHEAGTTIQIPPEYRRNNDRYKFVIGQYTPAELARDYAKQGRDNPPREAYRSLQDELRHYIEAGDYGYQIEIKKAGITIADYTAGFGFDWSHYCEETLEEHALSIWREFDGRREWLREAITEAREALARLAA